MVIPEINRVGYVQVEGISSEELKLLKTLLLLVVFLFQSLRI